MAIRPYNPFEEMEQLFERMTRTFDTGAWSGMGTAMSLDVAEHDDEYVVTADLPGFAKADIDLTVEDDRLFIEARRESSDEHGGEHVIHQERRQESAARTISLPGPVSEGDVEATYRNGVLTVTLPKVAATAGSKRIDID